MMRRLVLLFALALAPFAACSDDPKASDTADATETTAPDVIDETAADALEEGTPDSAGEIEPDVTTCEHPCLNEFGKNDKSLCPSPQSEWVCTAGCCEPVFKCTADADCTTRGFSEGQCDDDRFACRCNSGSGPIVPPVGVEVGGCFTWLCAVAADCGDGQLCAGGACIPTPDDKGLAVRILDRQTVLTPGATYALHAEAFDPTDTNVVLGVTPTWISSDSDVVAVDADGLATGGSDAGVATITATHGSETATLTIENVLPEGEDITIVVRTELTWEPIVGRYAVVDAAGAAVAEDLPSDGIIRIPTTPRQGPWTVHIMGEENDWVSWAGLNAGTSLYLPIPKTTYGRVVQDQAGAFTDETVLRNVGIVTGVPDFTSYSYGGTLEIVLTTTGLSSALFDFSLPVLLGSDVKRYLHPDSQIPRVDKNEQIGVPGGIVFNLLGPAIPSYILTVPKGHQRLWSLGGKLNLNDVAEYSGAIFDAIGGGDLDFTKIVGAVFPLFREFWSGYSADVNVTATGLDATPIQHTQRLTTPMGFITRLDVPKLPAIDALGYADGLFLLSGAQTLDGFMVPLGLSGGADTSDKVGNPADGFADGDEKTPVKDPFSLPAAPLHEGLQGPTTQYVVAAVAASIPVSGDPRPSAGSATLARWGAGVHPPADFALPAFLGFPSLATMGTNFETREVKTAQASGTELLRVLLKGKRGAHWTFYGVSGTLLVPNPADFGVAEDRFAKDALESVLVNCLDFVNGIDLGTFGHPGGLALDLLLGIVERVSFIDLKNTPLPE